MRGKRAGTEITASTVKGYIWAKADDVGIHQVRESGRGPAENAIKVLEKKLPSHGVAR